MTPEFLRELQADARWLLRLRVSRWPANMWSEYSRRSETEDAPIVTFNDTPRLNPANLPTCRAANWNHGSDLGLVP
jgi:hypothetical protein